MSAVSDIVATYGGPRRVVRRILQAGVREERALVILMAGCVVVFVAQWPRLARQAHEHGQELNPLLGGALFAWLFVMPLVLYTLALISHWVLRILGGKGQPFGARIALFWALLASGPIMLLWGLTAGFVGPGSALTLVGVIWIAVFLWVWFSGLTEVWRGA
ncbi:YIP1 family protein [Rhodobacteraceae bacterium LMO-12]|nr:YIP1 family protein [Rhodobacteraceae bacterium LMO-JJ12]